MVQTIPKYSIFLCSYFPYTIYMVIQLKVLSCCLKKKVIYKTGSIKLALPFAILSNVNSPQFTIPGANSNFIYVNLIPLLSISR